MNKIFNWTFGSVFRTFGRVFAYILIGVLFSFIMSKSGLKITDLLGIDTIHASTLNYDYSKFFVAGVDSLGENQSWSSSLNLGDYFRYEEQTDPYLSAIRVRFGVNSNFQANTTYLVRINTIWGQSGNGSLYQQAKSIICQGSRTSTWSSDENIVSCEYVGRTLYNDNNNAGYYFKITPSVNVYGIQIAWYYKRPPNNMRLYMPSIQNIRVLPSSKIEYDNSTSDSINNSTTTIINNNEKNTENIINNQNELLGNQCPNLFDYKTAIIRNGYLVEGGSIMDIHSLGNNRMIFLKVEPGQTYTITRKIKTGTFRVSSYNSIPTMTSTPTDYNVQSVYTDNNGVKITYTPQYKYLIIHYGHIVNDSSNIEESFKSIMVVKGTTSKPFCEYGTYQSKLDDTNNAINNLNDTMNNSDSSGAQSDAGNFFSGFNTNTHGLTGIITAPLNAIQSLTNQSCSPLVIPLPFVNQNLSLPCMRTIYVNTFGEFMTLYDIIVIGIISYWIMVRIFAMVKDFKNPEHDEVEVVDL